MGEAAIAQSRTDMNPAGMELDLSRLDYVFRSGPLLIGGKAMEYYGLRQAGADIDFVVVREDYEALAARYPDRLKDLWGDLGVCPFEFGRRSSLYSASPMSAGTRVVSR